MMPNFLLQNLRTLFFCLLPALLIGYFVSPFAGLLFFTVCISVWLVVHLVQIGLLLLWLARPKPSTIPTGVGIWQPIFSTLLRQAKSRKKRKRKINVSLQRLYQAADAMPNGIIVVDSNGRINWMNKAGAEHFDLDSEADRYGILINLIRVPGFQEFLEEADSDKEMKIRMNGGQPHLLAARAIAFSDDLKMLVSQDITRIEKLDTTRSDFVANVSHELRTPLTVVNGFLETFIEEPDMAEADRRHFVGLMQKESRRMMNLLSDLLILSRLESGSSETVKEAVNLSSLVRQLFDEGRMLSAGAHQMSAQITPDLWVSGIYHDLYNGLSNILFNAIRYTPAGGEIVLTLAPEDGRKARYAVRDTGPGIEPDHLPRLTERFYRVDKGRSRQKGGTGLGLAITKHVLAEHHSVLEVESEYGKGSTFSCVLQLTDPPVPLNA